MQSPSPDQLVITATNGSFRHLKTTVSAHTILFRISITLTTKLMITITIRNFGRTEVSGSFNTKLAADFRDMFPVRGMKPKDRVKLQQPKISGKTTTLAATSLDGSVISTRVTSPNAADIVPMKNIDEAVGIDLHHPVTLDPGQGASISIDIAPEPVGQKPEDISSFDESSGFTPRLAVASPTARFNDFISQCDKDLALLQTTFPDGNIPAAGIPWYIAPFGRDSLIVALQTMPYYPTRVANTLKIARVITGNEIRHVSRGATRQDPSRDTVWRSGTNRQGPTFSVLRLDRFDPALRHGLRSLLPMAP